MTNNKENLKNYLIELRSKLHVLNDITINWDSNCSDGHIDFIFFDFEPSCYDLKFKDREGDTNLFVTLGSFKKEKGDSLDSTVIRLPHFMSNEKVELFLNIMSELNEDIDLLLSPNNTKELNQLIQDVFKTSELEDGRDYIDYVNLDDFK